MHQLVPEPFGDDLAARYARDERPTPQDRPWVVAGMITSVDGAATAGATSGGLGSHVDRQVLRAVRGVADVILVGATTVRAERYGVPAPRPEPPPDAATHHLARRPRLAVVTAGCDLDPTLPMLADPDHPPLVLTTPGAPDDRCAALERHAEVVRLGRGARLTPGEVLGHLHDRGATTVVCEGGPTLLGQLVAADLVDELCLTVAPLLVGGSASRIAVDRTTDHVPRDLELVRVLEEDGYLFLRYVRRPPGP